MTQHRCRSTYTGTRAPEHCGIAGRLRIFVRVGVHPRHPLRRRPRPRCEAAAHHLSGEVLLVSAKQNTFFSSLSMRRIFSGGALQRSIFGGNVKRNTTSGVSNYVPRRPCAGPEPTFAVEKRQGISSGQSYNIVADSVALRQIAGISNNISLITGA